MTNINESRGNAIMFMRNKSKAYTLLISLLITLVVLTSATFAWFSLSTRVNVNNISMSVNTPSNIFVANGVLTNPSASDWVHDLDMSGDNSKVKGRLNLTSSATGYNNEFFYTDQANEVGAPAGNFKLVLGNDISISNGTDTTSTGFYADIPIWFKSTGEAASVPVDMRLNLEESKISIATSVGDATGLAMATRVAFLKQDGNLPAYGSVPLVFIHSKYDGTTDMFHPPVVNEAKYIRSTNSWDVNPFGKPITPVDDTTVIIRVTDVPTRYVVRVWIEGQDKAAIYNNILTGSEVDSEKLQISIDLAMSKK